MKKLIDKTNENFLRGAFFLHKYHRKFVCGEGNWLAAVMIRSLVIIVPLLVLIFGALFAAWVSDAPRATGLSIASALFVGGLLIVVRMAKNTLRERHIVKNGRLIKGSILSFETAFNYNESNGVRVHYEFVSSLGLVKGQAEGPGNVPKSKKYSHVLLLYVDEKNYIVL